MKVLVTGHNGYIGSVMVQSLVDAGHDVSGLDSYLFETCTFGSDPPDPPSLRLDVRDVQRAHLEGFDAVIHLAALCNDPLGNLNPEATFEVNYRASVRLAELSKAAGVPRFLFASSCSLYGVAGDAVLDEDAPFNPITPYGVSKVKAEQDIVKLADGEFSPTFLRNATAYGVSARLRGDVVLNNLVGFACTTGRIVIQSDGTPWRPVVHVADICRAFLAVLDAPRERVHGEAFNVGRTDENYRVRELADAVREVLPACEVHYADGGGPDPRSYRVSCAKLVERVPGFQPAFTIRDGVRELVSAFQHEGLSAEDFLGSRYMRIKRIQELQGCGRLDDRLRWIGVVQDGIGPAAATGGRA